jgi:hypothetical protein
MSFSRRMDLERKEKAFKRIRKEYEFCRFDEDFVSEDSKEEYE